MKRIYTRTGDFATTGIHGGERVPKDDIRVEANGSLDELNAQIGIIRSMLPSGHEWDTKLKQIQIQLMTVMSHVATPSDLRTSNPNSLDPEMDRRCEEWMDSLTVRMPDGGHFLLPGGTPLSAQLQYARTVARRAERRLCTLNRHDPLPQPVLSFVNRLSDLLFVLARFELHLSSIPEERWNAFSYKNRNSGTTDNP